MDADVANATALPPTNGTESLIAELNTKLVELDLKVLLYRRDMAKQFSKFTEERLKGETEEVRQQVTEAVRKRLKKSSLANIPEDAIAPVAVGSPPFAGNLEVTEVGGQIANQISKEMTQETREGKRPAPVAVVDIEGEEDIPRSPHARENEFLGVFTQGYLPLLDSDKQHARRSGSIVSDEGTAALPIRRPQSAEEDQSQGLSVSYSLPRSGAHPHKPEHQRRHTGDAASLSDPEGHKPRRSALRRTSSNSSGKAYSLRKVRFEFAGVEFPTTSSPVVDAPLSTAAADDLPLSSLSSSAVNDDDSDTPETEQVEFIEDIDVEPPAPKRISSSQALRMLSRGPIEDDGTQWEEVVAPEDGSPSVAVEQANLDSDDEDVLSLGLGLKRSRSDEKKSPSPPQSPIETIEEEDEAPQVEKQEEITPEEKAEEEDILADMTPLAPMHSTRSVMGNNASVTTTTTFTPFATGIPITAGIPISESTAIQQPLHDMSPVKSETTTNIPSTGSLTALPRTKQKAKAFILPDDSDDDLPFEFEDNSGASTPRKQARPPSPIEDDDESDTSSESPMSPERGVPESLSMYASSPARNIAGQEASVISPTTLNTFNNSNLPGAGSLKPTGTFGSLRSDNSSLGRAQGDSAMSSTPIPGTPPMQMGSLRGQANMMGREGGSSLRNSWHPFQIPVVDPRLNEEARQWGEDRSFVGSVSGRTGLDEWDGVGYAGSLRGQGSGSLRQTSGGRVIPQREPQAGRRGGGSVAMVGSAGGGKPMSFSQRMEEEEKAAEWERQRKGRGN